LQAENASLFNFFKYEYKMNQRIWIYTLSKELSKNQLIEFKNKCDVFVNSWTAHDTKLDASYDMYKDRLLLFKVNEASYNASGCSIDKQVRFVKDLEITFSIELLNRMLVAYNHGSELKIIHQSKIKDLIASKGMNENTLIYNNAINFSSDLETNWQVPLHKTWLAKYLN